MAELSLDSSQALVLRVDTATHNAPIKQILTMADRWLFITVGSDKRMKVWDADTLEHRRTLLGEIGSGNDGDLREVALSPRQTDPVLAVIVDRVDPETGATHRVLRLYDIDGDPERWAMLGAFGWDGDLNDLAFTADGRHLITAVAAELEVRSVDSLRQALGTGSDRLLPAPAPDASTTMRNGSMRMTAWADSDGSTRVAVSVWEGHQGGGLPEIYQLTGTDSGRPAFRRIPFDGAGSNDDAAIYPAEYRPHELAASHRHLAVAAADGGPVRVYDHDGRLLHTVTDAGAGIPGRLAFSPDGSRLVVGSKRRTGTEVTVHDADDGFRLIGRRAYPIEAGAVGFIDDWTVVSAGGNEYAIDAWQNDSLSPTGLDRRASAGSSTVHGLAIESSSVNGLISRRIVIGHPRRAPTDPPPTGLLETDGPVEADGTDVIAPIDTRHHSNPYPPYEYRVMFDPRRRLHANDPAALSAEGLARFEGPLPHEHDGTELEIRYPSVNLFAGSAWVSPLDGWDYAESFGYLPTGQIVFGGRSGTVQVLSLDDWDIQGRLLDGHTDQVLALAANHRWLVTGGLDQVIRFWYVPDAVNPSTGNLRADALQPALNLFVTNDGEWVLWSPSGYYDASSNGDNYIGFHKNQGEGREAEAIASDRYACTLYQPELITRILKRGSEEAALAELDIPELDLTELPQPPLIELEGQARRDESGYVTSLAFTVTDGTLPPSRIWITGNGTTVWEAEEVFVPYGQMGGPDDRSGRPQQHRYQADGLQLLPGPNRFRIMARNDEVKATPVEVVITPIEASTVTDLIQLPDDMDLGVTGPLEPEPPTLRQRTAVKVTPTEPGSVELVVVHDGSETLRQTIEHPGGADLDLQVDLEPGVNQVRVTSTNGQGDSELHTSTHVLPRLPPRLPPPVGSIGGGSSRTGASSKDASSAPISVSSDSTADGPTTPPEPVARNLFLVSIGVSKHATPADNMKDLDYAHRDARLTASRFAASEGRLYGNVWRRVLTDEDATRDRIRTELQNLKKATAEREQWKKDNHKTARDLTVFFFSGHGATVNPSTSERELLLITHDVDPDKILTTGLPVPEVGEVLSSLPTDIVVLIDACRAGRAGRDLIRRIDEKELGKRLHEIGDATQAVFASARYNQLSQEHSALQHGVFTYALLQKLAVGGGQPVAIGELTNGVQRWVKESTSTWPTHKKQEPSWRTYGDFPLIEIYN